MALNPAAPRPVPVQSSIRLGDRGPGAGSDPAAKVVPIRPAGPQIEIVREPEPSGGITISIDDDGLVEIAVGGSEETPNAPKFGGSEFNRNLAEDLDGSALVALASFLIEGVDADIADRRDWEDTANMGASYLGIKLEDTKAAPAEDGTICQAVSTAMLESLAKLWGTGRGELLPVDGPVKVERLELPEPTVGVPVEQPDPEQDPQTMADKQGDALAEALERDMNWYLTKGDPGYYPDTSKMIWHRYLIGLGFKEVYRCPIERKPISRWVMAQDLIVSGDPSHLGAAKRVTKRAKIDQATMRRLQVRGHFLDIPLAAATGQVSETEIVVGQTQGVVSTPQLPRDFDHTVYEVCCNLGSGTNHDLVGSLGLLDLDENENDPGYPLPYHVSIDLDSRTVLAIRRNWKQGDEDHRARRRFIKFGFLPGFGFYDMGLIHSVGNALQGATMLSRSVIDAGMLSNFPAWALMQGAASRLEQTSFRPGPGEVVKIPSTGPGKISDVLMPWPYKEPSAATMQMVSKLEGDVKSMAGVLEIPVGEGRIGNTPVGTIMSYIESISQVPGAVHKDDHIAQQQEFEMLRELLAEEPDVLYRGNRSPARKWQVAEELLRPTLVPRADPNTPSQIHRLTKVQGLVSAAGLQQFQGIPNQRAIWEYLSEVLTGTDSKRYTNPPPVPQPAPVDPRVQAATIKAKSEQEKAQVALAAKQIDAKVKTQTAAASADEHQADRESAETRAAMQVAAARAKAAGESAHKEQDRAHDAYQQAADRTHDVLQSTADRTHDANQATFSAPLSGDGNSGGGGSSGS